jgi:isoquinoline 1-oxidoreductase beta subunit
MLIRAAAAQWSVRAAECDTEVHAVVHRATGRRAGYGELVAAAAKLPLPDKTDLRLKPKEKWRYIGKGVPSKDVPGMCNGAAVFGMDVRLDDMVYASIERPPVFGGKVTSYDDKEALAVPGVLQTVAIEPFKPPAGFQPLGGVAVIATNTWAARARETEDRLGARPKRELQFRSLQAGIAGHGSQALQGRAG